MGHKNIQETLNTYAHWTKKQEDIYSSVLDTMFTRNKKDDTTECVIPKVHIA